MKLIKLKDKEYSFIEITDEYTLNKDEISLTYIDRLKDIDFDFKVISTTQSITEELVKDIVFYHVVSDSKYYTNYSFKGGRDFRDVIDASFKTALESFSSLMNYLNLDNSKNYLLIQKI